MSEQALKAPATSPPLAERTEPLLRISDNPILIGQARRRLRPRQVLPSLLIPAMIGLCGVLLVSQQSRDLAGAWATLGYCSLIYIGIVLFLRGTIQVSGSLGEERHSGILDFHRATPTTPWTDAIGYLLGAPAREYLIAAVGLPFVALSAIMAGPKLPLQGVVGLLGVMLLSTWLYHTLAMVVGLSISNRRGVAGAALLSVVAVLWMGVGLHRLGFVTLSYLTPFPAAYRLLELGDDALGRSVSFFGVALHPVLFTMLVQGSVLGFLFVGVTRKLRRDGAATFSRPGAGAFMSLLMFLSFAGSWKVITGANHAVGVLEPPADVMALPTVYLFGAMTVSCLLLLGLSPSYLEYVRALRGARRRGLHEARWLDDGAAAWPLAAMFGVLVLTGLGALAVGMGHRIEPAALLSQQTATCVLAVLSFLSLLSGAIEYVELSQRRSALGWSLLLLFVLAVLPWALAYIADVGGAGKSTPTFLAALSPTFGLGAATIGMSARWASDAGPQLPSGALALSLALTMGLSGVFLYKIRMLQQRLAATMPLGRAS